MNGPFPSGDRRGARGARDHAASPGLHGQLREGSAWAREPCVLPAWPDGAVAAASITVDFDADTPLYGEALDAGAPSPPARLSALSDRQFGAARGVHRLLDVFADAGVGATFFVPGRTADVYRAEVEAIAAGGHEIGHHGLWHRANDLLTLPELRAELDGGFEALDRVVGRRPRGYRSPSWEYTEATLDLLIEHGFDYDSSLMGDDRPYRLIRADDGAALLELPVHWSLDDYPSFPFGVAGVSVATAFETWRAELRSAIRDRRHVTFTVHPEVIGRGHRAEGFRSFMGELAERDDVWLAPLAAVADHVAGVGAQGAVARMNLRSTSPGWRGMEGTRPW